MFQIVPVGQGAGGWARVALLAGAGTMTTAWLALWVALLDAAAHPATLAGLAQAAMLFAGAVLARWLLVGPLGQRWVGVIFTVAALLAVALVVWALYYRVWLPMDPRWLARGWRDLTASDRQGALLGSGITALVLWWAGGRIGASALDDYAVFRVFVVGLAGLFGGLFIGALAGVQGPPSRTMGAAATLFFAASFLTLPLAQIITVRERGRATGARPPALDRRWLLPSGGAMALILALGLLLSVSISGALLGAVANGLARLPDLVAFLLQPLILLAALVLEALLGLAHWLAHVFGVHPHTAPAQPPPIPKRPTQRPVSHGHVPALLSQALRWGALALGAVAAAAILGRTVRRASGQRRESAFEEERESVWSWREARGGLHSLLAHLGDRLRRPSRRADTTDAPPGTIREVYRLLLRAGARLGRPRAAAETPREYLERLRGIPISDERDASLLTLAYMGVRYGDEPEDEEDLARALRAWERLVQALHAADQQQEGRSTR